MWNYEKGNKLVLKLFDQECKELCYTQTMPEKVMQARAIIEACKTGEAAEDAKDRVMRGLRASFDPDKYDWDKITLYDEEGLLKEA